MKCKYIQYLVLLLAVQLAMVGSKNTCAQTPSDQQVVQIQPKIMVIPYTKEGQDIRTILEDDINNRVIITKVKEAFDKRGFSTVDFVAKLKLAKDNQVFVSDNQSDIKSQIISMSGADIYVEIEYEFLKTNAGNRVSLIMSGFEASTAISLANKHASSNYNNTNDVGKLAVNAVNQVSEEFLKVMQEKFNEMVLNGRPVYIDISLSSNSTTSLDDEMGPDQIPLRDIIEEWMADNALKNNYHLAGATNLKMIFDEVRIPLKDPINGRNYTTSKFALKLYKYFKTLGLKVTKDVKSNSIIITIE